MMFLSISIGKFNGVICLATITLTACQTIPNDDTALFDRPTPVATNSDYEQAGLLQTSRFISADKMASPFHKVGPETYNNGYSNRYKVEGSGGTYVVEGTRQAEGLINGLVPV